MSYIRNSIFFTMLLSCSIGFAMENDNNNANEDSMYSVAKHGIQGTVNLLVNTLKLKIEKEQEEKLFKYLKSMFDAEFEKICQISVEQDARLAALQAQLDQPIKDTVSLIAKTLKLALSEQEKNDFFHFLQQHKDYDTQDIMLFATEALEKLDEKMIQETPHLLEKFHVSPQMIMQRLLEEKNIEQVFDYLIDMISLCCPHRIKVKSKHDLSPSVLKKFDQENGAECYQVVADRVSYVSQRFGLPDYRYNLSFIVFPYNLVHPDSAAPCDLQLNSLTHTYGNFAESMFVVGHELAHIKRFHAYQKFVAALLLDLSFINERAYYAFAQELEEEADRFAAHELGCACAGVQLFKKVYYPMEFSYWWRGERGMKMEHPATSERIRYLSEIEMQQNPENLNLLKADFEQWLVQKREQECSLYQLD